MKYTTQEIKNARHILKESGYMVESLWSLPDILHEYQTRDRKEVDKDTAYEILENAVTDSYIMEKIWEVIDDIASNDYNLMRKDI